jgi:hypothetical protein
VSYIFQVRFSFSVVRFGSLKSNPDIVLNELLLCGALSFYPGITKTMQETTVPGLGRGGFSKAQHVETLQPAHGLLSYGSLEKF